MLKFHSYCNDTMFQKTDLESWYDVVRKLTLNLGMMLLQDKSGVLQAIYQIASPRVQSIKLNWRVLGTGLIMDGLYSGLWKCWDIATCQLEPLLCLRT